MPKRTALHSGDIFRCTYCSWRLRCSWNRPRCALGKQLIWATLASGLFFLLFPATLGFTRVAPADPVVAGIYRSIFAIDPPHNLVPSLHVVWSAAIALAVRDNAGRWGRWLFSAWLGLIALSSLLVHQHHIADVLVALALVALTRKIIGGTRTC